MATQLKNELEVPPNKKLDILCAVILGLYLAFIFGMLRYYAANAAGFFIYQIAMLPIAMVLGSVAVRIFIKKPAVTIATSGLSFNRLYVPYVPSISWQLLDKVEIRRILFADYYLLFIKEDYPDSPKLGVIARLNKMLFGAPYTISVSRLKIPPELFKASLESYKALAIAG